MSQMEIPYDKEPQFLEDVPNWEEKERLHDIFLAWKAAVEKKELVQGGRASAEHFVDEFNKTFGENRASCRFSNWQGYGSRGGYVIKIDVPPPASYRDILDKEGKRLPSRKTK
jgi:hypothetical protein